MFLTMRGFVSRVLKKEEEACERKRAAEEERRRRAKVELVDKEEERVAEVDESARAREVRRREAAAARQEREYQEEVESDRAKREAKVSMLGKMRFEQERQDEQVIKATCDNPHRMPGHPGQIAPYAMQQRPMVAKLNRWKHWDNDEPDHDVSRPLANKNYRLVDQQAKALRPYDGQARAYDEGVYMSRKWVDTRPW